MPTSIAGSDVVWRRHRYASGFTLVELLIVLVLVGIGVSLAAFSVDRLAERTRERQWSDRTQQELKRLRNKAILSSKLVEATVHFQRGELLLVNRGASMNVVMRLPEQYHFASAPGQSTSTLSSQAMTLRFLPDGSMQEARFFLSTPSGTWHGFHLASVSGRIERFDAPPAAP